MIAFIIQIPAKKFKHNILLMMMAPDFLLAFHQSQTFDAMADHVEWFVIIARSNDKIVGEILVLQNCSFNSSPPCINLLPFQLILEDKRMCTTTTLPNDALHLNLLGKRVYCMRKIHRIHEIIHLPFMHNIPQVPQHVDETTVHETKTFCQQCSINRLVSKIKFPITYHQQCNQPQFHLQVS